MSCGCVKSGLISHSTRAYAAAMLWHLCLPYFSFPGVSSFLWGWQRPLLVLAAG